VGVFDERFLLLSDFYAVCRAARAWAMAHPHE
jgi:hypothetical protein